MTAPNQSLNEVRQARRGDYPVRSRHRDEQGEPLFINHLILEDSPYLLQHAHNPVNWYPWGEEAFAIARSDNKPIFLSIGYATCHWCHVMEEDSFDDIELAELLNRFFVSIKVDREQRPDLDDLYMTGVQLLTGQGGWPMTCLLTPRADPFFAATFLPRDQLNSLLSQIIHLWHQQPRKLIDSGRQLREAIAGHCRHRSATEMLGEERIKELTAQLTEQLLTAEDQQHGGLGRAPKFPAEPQLLMLLNQLQRAGNQTPEHRGWPFVRRALDGMLRGGICDQVGGGFHRYATDAAWLVPHFEKMLYNQAQLALVYSHGWWLSGDPEYRRIATATLDYVLSEMRADDGGFYSATDADSEGEEGRFFSWPWSELQSLFEEAELQLLSNILGLTPQGQFEGRNIPHLPRPLEQQAAELGLSYKALLDRLRPLLSRLYQTRQTRVQPLRDEKQITEWNAMMVVALCEAGRLFDLPRYRQAARDCGEVLWTYSRSDNGELCRNRMRSRPSVRAALVDYGWTLQALIALFDASREPLWLERAGELAQVLFRQFEDPDQGGFYNSAASCEGPLPVRSKEATDNTSASGNSAVLTALVQLQRRRPSPELAGRIEGLQACYSALISEQPMAFPVMLTTMVDYRQPPPADICYAADGHIRIDCCLNRNNELSVRIRIEDGWHIGTDQPDEADQPEQTATRLGCDDSCDGGSERLTGLRYPAASRAPSAADSAPPYYWQNEIEIRGNLATEGDRLPVLTLRFQACSQHRCLAPEALQLLPRRS